MGRRQDSVDPRVWVSVSDEMLELRNLQWQLNQFLWTSEIAYAYLLSNAPAAFPDADVPAIDVLGHLMTQAWYPSNQGNIKYRGTIGDVLGQTAKNTTSIYRAVIVFFASAFEHYLESRIGSRRNKTQGGSWGPYVQSLSIPELKGNGTAGQGGLPVQLKTLLEADFVREIRNSLVHTSRQYPQSLDDPESRRIQHLAGKWCGRVGPVTGHVRSLIRQSATQVFGQAENHVKQARQADKDLPIDLFYALFTFTNLDKLAFEIEEALLRPPLPPNRIQRKKAHVRRKDIVLGPVETGTP